MEKLEKKSETSNFNVKMAGHAEIERMIGINPEAQGDKAAKNFIYQSVAARNAFVVQEGAQIVGYGVLEYVFFDYGLVSVLFVDPEHRKKGVAQTLLAHLEKVCKTQKIFVLFESANDPAKKLMSKLKFKSSGSIKNLDEGGTKALYFKLLPKKKI